MQISSINYKELNNELRIDAEYYREEILNQLDVLDKHKNDSLDNLVDFVIGPFGSTVTIDQYVKNSDYRYIRNKDINDFVIGDKDIASIPKDLFDSLPKYHLKKDDLLITVVGTLGKAAIVMEKDTKSIFSCKSTLLRCKNINPFFLLAYLNSETGRLFSLRGKRGAIQEGLNLPDLKEIQVPVPSEQFQTLIEETIRKSFMSADDSVKLYNEANALLLAELDLAEWKPKHQLTFIKSYSDVQKAGRIGADYFQPFYDEVNEKLQSTGFVSAREICCDINYGAVPTSPYTEDKSGVPYIKGLNLKGLQVVNNKLDYITNTEELPEKVFTKEGDIIISQMGTVGNCGVVSKEQEGCVFASFTIRMRLSDTSKFDPYFVALYIEKIAKPYYLIRNISQASVRQNTDLPTINNMPIPDISRERQKKISSKLTKSFESQKNSKHLLECAKNAIELAIGTDEKEATSWLKKQLKR